MTVRAALGVAAGLLVVPFVVTDSFHLNTLILVLLFGTAAQAWNLLGGYAGQLSFGHSVFFGLGAYTSSVLLSRYGIVPWTGALVGAAIAVAVSLAIGTPTFRLRRHFFALATLALGEIVRITWLNWGYVGAALGLYLPLQYRNIAAYMMWDGKRPYYFLTLGLFAVAMAITTAVDRSRLAVYLKAINQDEDAARALGLDVQRHKQWAMGASAALSALAGSVYAQYVLYIDPYTVMTARISLLVVVMALIGGRGTVWGPALGAAFIVLLSEYTRSALGHLGSGYDFILFGLLIMLLSLYEPRGLYGILARTRPRALPQIEGAAPGREAPASAPNHHALCSVHALTKRFGGIVALDRIALEVKRGEILCLIGPNGAGKSTLFDCITGFQRPQGGSVWLDGQVVTGIPVHRIVRLGLVRTFQLIRLFSELTVWENLLAAQPHAGEGMWTALQRTPLQIEAQAAGLLRIVGLLGYRSIPASELSYGQQKLLSLAMALMTNARLILLDEPTAGVSPAMIKELIVHIQAANRQGRTFLIIEHNMEVVNALAHRIYFMADGRILTEGRPGEIRRDPRVLEAYYGH
jgi:branched-chain amino acid transport system permease protein